MNQKPTIPGVDPFTFAGFQWPRHLAIWLGAAFALGALYLLTVFLFSL